jgi:putative NADH-flavin reductase
MARLLIMGASGGIGLETVKAALAAGHAVRAFARSANKIAIDDPFLEKVDGDATDPAAVTAALAGQDGVIQSLGVPLNPDTVLRGTQLFSQATRVLVDAMGRPGPERLIVVTGFGAGDSRMALGPLAILTGGRETACRALIDPKAWRPGTISRVAVAAFIIAHLDDAAYIRQTPELIS